MTGRGASIALCLAAAWTALPAGAAGEGSSAELGPLVVAIRPILERMRGLEFTSPILTQEAGREEARAHLAGLVREEYPPARLAAEQEALVYLGLLPPGLDLERLMLDLIQSQVAGFYDPKVKKLFVVPGPLAGSLALAHEMAHALADQHFDLEEMERRSGGNDDRDLALAALIEGEATMVTYLWAFRSAMDPSMPPLTEGDPAEAMRAAASGLDGAPPFLVEGLTFPYVGGAAWAASIMKRGEGLREMDAYFRHPPESTEQILHPEKSVAPRDVPSLIEPGPILESIGAEEPVVKSDAMGEFGIRFLLGGATLPAAVEAAAGWDGDWFIVGGSPEARHLTWVSIWDTEEDAAAFAEALSGWLEGRGGARDRSHHVGRRQRVVVAAEGTTGSGRDAASRTGLLLQGLPRGVQPR